MTGRRPVVTIVQRVIRSYRVPFYAGLRAELQDRGLDLAVLHNTPERDQELRRDTADLPWADHVPSRTLALGSKHLLWQPAPRQLWKSDLIVVEQASRMLLNYRLLGRRPLGGPKVAFWGHGMSRYPDAHAASEKAKRWLATRPDWWFAYTDGVAALIEELGFPADRITSVRNSTDTERLAAQVSAVSSQDVTALRRELSLRGHLVGTFIGSLVPEKGLGFLLKAVDEVRRTVPGFEFIVAGDGQLAPWIEEEAERRPWMHYMGQRYDADLATLLRVSSLLLTPSWVGLVITDGFAGGLPVVASSDAAHPPEIEYLRHGENGLLVEDAGDPQRYAAAVIQLLEDPDELTRLQEGARAAAENYTMTNMVFRFADGLACAVHRPRRR